MTVRAGSLFGSCGGINVGCLVVVLVVKLFPHCSSGVFGESQLAVVADDSQVGLLRDSSFDVMYDRMLFLFVSARKKFYVQ